LEVVLLNPGHDVFFRWEIVYSFFLCFFDKTHHLFDLGHQFNGNWVILQCLFNLAHFDHEFHHEFIASLDVHVFHEHSMESLEVWVIESGHLHLHVCGDGFGLGEGLQLLLNIIEIFDDSGNKVVVDGLIVVSVLLHTIVPVVSFLHDITFGGIGKVTIDFHTGSDECLSFWGFGNNVSLVSLFGLD
jgi:hypothetical protein